ncbi:MAG: recombinase family protein, partial [Alicycliphilus denitrificans]|nr:recombinase family protein [Alicycliphilus denitrificans]
MSQPRVYSYRRFSSERQAQGHSLERQTAAARVWCQENGHVLDEDLALSDLGISVDFRANLTPLALVFSSKFDPLNTVLCLTFRQGESRSDQSGNTGKDPATA